MTSFTQSFAHLLQSRGWNQKVAAERLGVSQANVSRWLNGEREPGIDALIQIAHGLDVTVDELLGRSEISRLKSQIKTEIDQLPTTALNKFKERFRAADPALHEFMAGQVRALFGAEAKKILGWLSSN